MPSGQSWNLIDYYFGKPQVIIVKNSSYAEGPAGQGEASTTSTRSGRPSGCRRGVAVLSAGVLAGASLLLGAAPAQAQTGVSAGGGSLQINAATGEANNITVSRVTVPGGARYQIHDSGDTLDPGTGCSRVNSHTVRCTTADVRSITVNARDGHDTVTLNVALPATVRGGDGNDTLRGGEGGDSLWGGAGHDSLYGRGGHDGIRGEDGNDTIHGGEGNDTVRGGNGNDDIHGQSGNDSVHGENGHDTVHGGNGNDTIRGGDGNDTLHGNNHHDTIRGDNGNDFLYGEDGNDSLRGDAGTDSANGGPGNDTCSAENRVNC